MRGRERERGKLGRERGCQTKTPQLRQMSTSANSNLGSIPTSALFACQSRLRCVIVIAATGVNKSD